MNALRSLIIVISVALGAVFSAPGASALSFDVDSIASWGKFPRFCMKVYDWGEEFFNGYDSLYVSKTHTYFNVKLNSESWSDIYNFDLPEGKSIRIVSDPATSAGVSIAYLAVSLGYDINVSRFFGGPDRKRKRFKFGFNCSLLAVEYYNIHNDGGTHITRFGDKNSPEHMRIDFTGIDTHTQGFDAYVFLNQKRYSQAAAFNFGRYQLRSAGSFFVGVSYFHNSYNFDFSNLPHDMREQLPDTWENYCYNVNTDNYCLRLGYGYNWVLNRHWLIGISESPVLGLQNGHITGNTKPFSASLANRLAISFVWNNKHWFAGVIGRADQGLIYNKKQAYINSDLSFNACIGYRFNLW
ncbi:MAG: DUF4421 domain-containing protein [Muribaculaceae bacterium]|nr:DUF4421 domain-containing protein [Muribaculaceae bacterium]